MPWRTGPAQNAEAAVVIVRASAPWIAHLAAHSSSRTAQAAFFGAVLSVHENWRWLSA